MKIVLQMTVTPNGLIAREDGSVDWTLKGTWNNYFKFCKQLGNLIIGRKTYDDMPIEEFVENCIYVVILMIKIFRRNHLMLSLLEIQKML